MIGYYFYNNISRDLFKSNRYLFLFSLILEIHNLIINYTYINNFFFTINNFSVFKNLKKKFNFNIFFFKIFYLTEIIKNYYKSNKKVKSWKILIFFFFIIFNSFLTKSNFVKFNLNINFNEFNLKNYFFKSSIIFLRIKKYPIRFIFFYFFINIYKIFLTLKNSLYIVKNLIYLNYDIFFIFQLVRVRRFLNFKLKYLIYI